MVKKEARLSSKGAISAFHVPTPRIISPHNSIIVDSPRDWDRQFDAKALCSTIVGCSYVARRTVHQVRQDRCLVTGYGSSVQQWLPAMAVLMLPVFIKDTLNSGVYLKWLTSFQIRDFDYIFTFCKIIFSCISEVCSSAVPSICLARAATWSHKLYTVQLHFKVTKSCEKLCPLYEHLQIL